MDLSRVRGHLSRRDAYPSRTGEDLTTSEGAEAAEAVMLNLLATLKGDVGELSRVSRFVKVSRALSPWCGSEPVTIR